MKVLIRDTETKLYLNGGSWVEMEDAHDFRGTAEAINFASQKHLGQIEIVHVFSEAQYNFSTEPIDFTPNNSLKSDNCA